MVDRKGRMKLGEKGGKKGREVCVCVCGGGGGGGGGGDKGRRERESKRGGNEGGWKRGE